MLSTLKTSKMAHPPTVHLGRAKVIALLDILIPANSVQERSIKLATFETVTNEIVLVSALRSRALLF